MPSSTCMTCTLLAESRAREAAALKACECALQTIEAECNTVETAASGGAIVRRLLRTDDGVEVARLTNFCIHDALELLLTGDGASRPLFVFGAVAVAARRLLGPTLVWLF